VTGRARRPCGSLNPRWGGAHGVGRRRTRRLPRRQGDGGCQVDPLDAVPTDGIPAQDPTTAPQQGDGGCQVDPLDAVPTDGIPAQDPMGGSGGSCLGLPPEWIRAAPPEWEGNPQPRRNRATAIGAKTATMAAAHTSERIT
jgi:hypothetical protein